MRKSNKINYLFALAGLFSLGIFMIVNVYASASYLSANIEGNYSSGESIRGNVRMTFANEPADNIFKSNFLGNITLLDLILNQTTGLIEGTNYTCSTENCENDLISSGAVSILNLDSWKVTYVGFKADGPGIQINNASLRINSNAPSSCSANLYVDVLGDGNDLLTSSISSGESCGIKHKGCYNQSNTAEAVIATNKEYCETITLPAAPSFLVGGNIRTGTGEPNLTMKMYDANTRNLLGRCKLPAGNTNTLEDLKCEINHTSGSEKDYYICVSTSLNNNDKIGWETSAPTCGTALGFNSFNSDFNLFVETIKYAASPSLIINESTYKKNTGLSLRREMDSYIQNHYDGNCQASSCLIPIRIYGDEQIVDFNDISLTYESYGVSASESTSLYELDFEVPKVSANNISLDLSKANFVIPINSNENKFKLYFDDDLLFQKNITIRRSFTFDVEPKFVAFGQNARFFVLSTTNITRTTWNFGDGTAKTVNGTFADHAFVGRNSSFYNLTVTAYSNQSSATRQFTITVGDPKILANETIARYRKSLTNITNQINSYPSWAIQRLQKMLELTNMTSELNSIETYYRSATTEEQYQNAMLDLIALNVPSQIKTTQSGDKIPLGVAYENMNINYLEEIDNKQVTDEESLKEQASAWMNDNFNAEVTYKAISRINEFGSEVFATLFTINTNPTSYAGQKAYLIMGQDVEVAGEYKTNYNPKSISASGIDYFELTGNTNSQAFEFILEGGFSPESLGAYIAPSIDVIGTVIRPDGECYINNICEGEETADSCPEDCSRKWFKFTIIWWIILAVFTIIAYIILQEWYKKDYQNSLFPDKNDLYNIVNFIYSARKSGMSDSEIREKLKQQKWSAERINFAFKKIDGKRTGMFEIPLFTRKEHTETTQQIANRQSAPVDARFIKRPY